jgi:hypothetical protein
MVDYLDFCECERLPPVAVVDSVWAAAGLKESVLNFFEEFYIMSMVSNGFVLLWESFRGLTDFG